MEEAIHLRREVPSWSVTELIRILEWEGIAEPGFLRRSTLQDQLAARGYSSRQMRIYSKDVTSARRFQKPWRNYLWQSDIKYGIHVDGQPTYMVCFLDDCTRNILHSQFYTTLDQSIVQDCFRQNRLPTHSFPANSGRWTKAAALNPQRYRMLYVSESKLTPTNFYKIVLEQLVCGDKMFRILRHLKLDLTMNIYT